MSGDTKWIIGTVVVLAALLSAQMAGQLAALNDRIDDVNNRLDDMRADLTARIDGVRDDLTARIDRLETRLDGIDARLRNVEIAFGKVDQRLLTLERILLPPREPAGG